MKSPFKSKAKDKDKEKPEEPQTLEQIFTCYACGAKKPRLEFRYFEEVDKSSYHVQPAPKSSRWWKSSGKQEKEKEKLVIYRYRCIHPMVGPCPDNMTNRKTTVQTPRGQIRSTSTPAADPPASPPSRPHVSRPETAYVPPNRLRIPLLRPLQSRNSPHSEERSTTAQLPTILPAHPQRGNSKPQPFSRRQSQPGPRMPYRPGPPQPPSLSLSQQVESLGHSLSGRPVSDMKPIGPPQKVEPAKPAAPSWYYPALARSPSEPANTDTLEPERVKSAPPAAAGWSQREEESWQDWMEIQGNAVTSMPLRAKNEAWKSSGWTGEHAEKFRRTGRMEHELS